MFDVIDCSCVCTSLIHLIVAHLRREFVASGKILEKYASALRKFMIFSIESAPTRKFLFAPISSLYACCFLETHCFSFFAFLSHLTSRIFPIYVNFIVADASILKYRLNEDALRELHAFAH